MQDDAPLISAETSLPELTLKAVVLGIILTIVLAASNAYLALKVGTTVAASIPASVLALGVFRFFRRSNVLETNLVQTSASAGEGLAAAVTFILPALIILGYWAAFKFWQTAIITILGGVLGVFFSVPLRRVLLAQAALPFPEGTAVGNVLRASTAVGSRLKRLIQGGLVGGVIVLFQTGFEAVASYLPLWIKSGKELMGITLGFDPTLIGAGYIIGINANMALFFGMVLCWVFGVPILCYFYGLPAGDNSYDQVMNLWDSHIRYIGVGTMISGGIWTLLIMLKPVSTALMSSYRSFKKFSVTGQVELRTERDISMKYMLIGTALILILSFFFIANNLFSSEWSLSWPAIFNISLISILAILILGFFSAVICGYLVGLIGSTNTPLSGIMIINVLILSMILLPLITHQVDLHVVAYQHAAIAIIIFVIALIGCAATITIENIQDLKAGRMVGATPWKQQLMMILGVVVSSIVIAPILQLLFQAYGIGGVYPHPGMNPAQMLSAPQAALLTSLAKGVVGHDLPWPMLNTGLIIGVFCIFIDEYLKTKGKHLAVLAVGLGIYLPPEVITPCVLGGLIHYFTTKTVARKTKTLPVTEQKEVARAMSERGILLACGLVAGSALMGVILAIPFVIKSSSDALRIVSDSFLPIANGLGVVITVLLCVWLYRVTCRKEMD